MDYPLLTHVLEWTPFLALLAGLARWVFQLQDKVRSAHERLDEMDKRHVRFEERNDKNMVEINRRIDDCKDSILKSINAVYQALNKT